MMRKRWIIAPTSSDKTKALSDKLNIPLIIAQLLANRNITKPDEAHAFLHADLSSLHDPFLLKGMGKAVSRIRKAVSKGEKILIYGDYDVDGVTSTALLSRVLKKLGANTAEYIPNRLEDGYGLNLRAAQDAYRKNAKVIITVDCGINAQKEIEYLNSLNIDTIVVDHHRLETHLKVPAYSIINPLQDGCEYPFKNLAGVGLAFKLACALLDKNAHQLRGHLDLVALGTISDVVSQLGENRILTKYGLDILGESEKVGIRELIRASSLNKKVINAGHVGFVLGPRINAAGRIGSADLALRLLTTEDTQEARSLADILNRENRSRQKLQNDVYEEAINKINKEINFKDHKVIVLSNEGWHPGVIGIVASRVAEQFYRPTIMISLNKNKGRGSARSIRNFHLFNAVSKCTEFLDSFGGHEGACGLTILPKFITKFRDYINEVADKMLSPEDLEPVLEADMKIPLHRLSANIINQIEKLSPFGPKNPEPLFISEDLTVKHQPRFLRKNGVKMWLTDGKLTCEAISFGLGSLGGVSKGDIVNVAYSPVINEWGGVSSIQLNLEDINTPY